MTNTKIFKLDYEVASRLSFFGVSRDELMRVVESAVGGRADAVPNDPLTAAGLFSYIYGTRGLREVFLPKGWYIDRTKNIESVIHPESGIKIIFQNVDLACNEGSPPKALSGKGMASEEIIDISTGFLFQEMEKDRQKHLNRTVWFFCVSVKGEDIMAELSLPLGIKEGQFSEFAERIFVLTRGEWGPAIPTSKTDESPETQDYDVPVSRK
ncbi:hypothetical protein [Desulfarculus baarsii]